MSTKGAPHDRTRCLSQPVGDVATCHRPGDGAQGGPLYHSWQFTSPQARTKLADLYPVIQTKVD